MKLAIHKSSWGFSPEWISYCDEHNIPYKIVNCYDSDIISQLRDCDMLLWHHHHALAKDKLLAKELLYALEQGGMKVYPNFHSGWHFDDKLGQKYLLEYINAPLVPTYAFYSKEDATKFIAQTSFPKVFKLRGGAGSSNVKLVHNQSDAKSLIKTAFGAGFKSYNGWGNLMETLRKYKLGKANSAAVLKSLRRLVVSTDYAKIHGREKGYVLFQDFIPNNNFDIRVVVTGEKAFAIKRMVRENDFRASGSGSVKHQREEIDIRCIAIAFDVAKRLKLQSVAYDFVFDVDNNPLIIEISYGFGTDGTSQCEGYWDPELQWHDQKINPARLVLESLINDLR